MRVKPPVCPDCGYEPWDCPSCGDYRCMCKNPMQVQAYDAAVSRGERPKRKRLMGSKHYDKSGKPYGPRFIDGFKLEPYPDDDEDLQWLIEGGLA